MVIGEMAGAFCRPAHRLGPSTSLGQCTSSLTIQTKVGATVAQLANINSNATCCSPGSCHWPNRAVPESVLVQ